MARSRSVFLGLVICLVNVLVIAAMLPDRTAEIDEPPTAKDKSTRSDEVSNRETASRAVGNPGPVIEFRRFTGWDELPHAEFCLFNRGDKPMFVFGYGGSPLVDSHVKSNGTWYSRDYGLCGTGLGSGIIKPGEQRTLHAPIVVYNDDFVPLSKAADNAPPMSLRGKDVELLRAGISYSLSEDGPACEVWSEPVNITERWRAADQHWRSIGR
jgi:hypothetical protein